MRARNTALCLSIAVRLAIAEPALPDPTGPLPIGRVTLLCIDDTRIEPFHRQARRIAVDIWYPAALTAPAESEPAAYLPVEAIENIIGAGGLRKQLGDSYNAIKSRVQTHAMHNAPFSHSTRSSPLLIFSPGGGMIRELYTAQVEDLASHGYIVAALTHTYDGFLTLFPDGSHARYDGKRWPRPPSVEGEASLNQLEWHAADIRFVLDTVTQNNTNLPFKGGIDRTRIGAFGHSFGGLASVRACQQDPRIKACMNQDGAVAMQPFFLDVRGWGLDQPFLLMERAMRADPPSDQELAEMQLTRQQLQMIRKRLEDRKDTALHATGHGAHHIILPRNETSHMDFSDLPLLAARNRAESDLRRHTLSIIRAYTRMFFDQSLKVTRPGAKASQRRGPSPSPTPPLPRIRRRQVITRIVHPIAQHPL